ncbi:MAG TPA: protein O-GlcNAcase [Acidimicrobiia bacterium]|nr:protein O-GlcNAcase [Acidimicrobiia bacterium]
MPRDFRLRGIVEGFYGPPWTHEARREVLSFLAPRGMNAYVYAPKDDPFHRARWREPYPYDEQRALGELASFARALGVQFGFAISPGLDIDYESPSDREQLEAKLSPLLDAGVEWVVLALDDIPLAPDLAPRQAALTTWLYGWLRDRRAAAQLTVCPTEYVGTRPSPYLGELAAGVPDAVSLLWTGPTVCSPTITEADAAAWTAAVAPHAVILWDNYPVNDGTMSARLHLGPYEGRAPALADRLGGVLLNPMTQPHASLVALASAMAFLCDPDACDADAGWEAAIAAVGGDRHDSLRVLAHACADGPLRAPAALELATLVTALDEEAEGPGWASAARALSAALRATKAALTDWPATDALAEEVAAWVAAGGREVAAALAAVRLLQGTRPVGVIEADGTGRAAAPDAEALLQLVFGLVFAWSGARANREVVFGPRFVIYPAVVQTEDGRPAVDVGMTLWEDANVVDWLSRIALREYERWREAADETVRVMVDGNERAVAADGTFDGRGAMALLRSGRLVTRVRPGEELPMRDRRLP